jgi:hypothetical protein
MFSSPPDGIPIDIWIRFYIKLAKYREYNNDTLLTINEYKEINKIHEVRLNLLLSRLSDSLTQELSNNIANWIWYIKPNLNEVRWRTMLICIIHDHALLDPSMYKCLTHGSVEEYIKDKYNPQAIEPKVDRTIVYICNKIIVCLEICLCILPIKFFFF